MRIALLIVLLTLLPGLTACEQTPTGRSQLALVPDAILSDLGTQVRRAEQRRQSTLVSYAQPRNLRPETS